MEATPWLFAVLGGAILLGLALAYNQMQTRQRDKQVDPTTPADDPARGMHDTTGDPRA